MAKRHLRLSTDFRGRVVTTSSYFDGDGDDHPDLAYAEYEGEEYPSAEDTAHGVRESWDASHITRLPVLLRSLLDTRGSSGTDFPSNDEVRMAANEFAHVEFAGDLDYPLLHNFFDGGDGWYRVNYAGRAGEGYSPSRFCDTHLPSHQCLTIWGIRGWGLLAPWSPDLRKVLLAFVRLASATDQNHVSFRSRYLEADAETFSIRSSSGQLHYSFHVFALLGDLMSPSRASR